MKGIIRKGSKAEARLRKALEGLEAMQKNGLKNISLSDFLGICQIGKTLVSSGVASTCITAIVEYYRSYGFKGCPGF